MMKALATIGTIYVIIATLLLVPGMGIGFLMHWALPSVELGTAILIGVVTLGLATHFFIRATASIAEYRAEHEEDSYEIYATPFIDPKRFRRRQRQRGGTA